MLNKLVGLGTGVISIAMLRLYYLNNEILVNVYIKQCQYFFGYTTVMLSVLKYKEWQNKTISI